MNKFILISSARSILPALVAGLALGTAACASQPPPPAAAATPPSEAFQRAAASPGAAESQGADDDIVFVDQQRKDPATHEDATPVTSLHADPQTARPTPHN
jgi:hypothetical protein